MKSLGLLGDSSVHPRGLFVAVAETSIRQNHSLLTFWSKLRTTTSCFREPGRSGGLRSIELRTTSGSSIQLCLQRAGESALAQTSPSWSSRRAKASVL